MQILLENWLRFVEQLLERGEWHAAVDDDGLPAIEAESGTARIAIDSEGHVFSRLGPNDWFPLTKFDGDHDAVLTVSHRVRVKARVIYDRIHHPN